MKKKKLAFGLAVMNLVFWSVFRSGAPAQEKKVVPKAMQSIHSSIKTNPPITIRDLTIVPISLEPEKQNKNSYITLDQATAKHLLRVKEKGSGEVPRLRLRYLGKSKAFIMTGEIVTGAKQDRISANDVLLGPEKDSTDLAVYCVEQGRWSSQSEYFASGGTTVAKKARKSAVNKASQGQIWNDVAEKSRESNVQSSTGTMQAVYRDPKIRKQIEAYRNEFQDLPKKFPQMIGFVALTGGKIISADLFGNPQLLSSLWEKLISSAALDALTSRKPGSSSDSKIAVQSFLSEGLLGQYQSISTPGMGLEFLIKGTRDTTGSVLMDQGQLVHLVLFSDDQGNGHREFMPPSSPNLPKKSSQSQNRSNKLDSFDNQENSYTNQFPTQIRTSRSKKSKKANAKPNTSQKK